MYWNTDLKTFSLLRITENSSNINFMISFSSLRWQNSFYNQFNSATNQYIVKFLMLSVFNKFFCKNPKNNRACTFIRNRRVHTLGILSSSSGKMNISILSNIAGDNFARKNNVIRMWKYKLYDRQDFILELKDKRNGLFISK